MILRSSSSDFTEESKYVLLMQMKSYLCTIIYASSKDTFRLLWAIRLLTFQWQEKYKWDFLGPELVSTSPWVSSIKEITNNTSYFGKAIWVAELIHSNWMIAIIEDSNTCMPLKYINRPQVKLKLSQIPRKNILWKFHCCDKLKLEYRLHIVLTWV